MKLKCFRWQQLNNGLHSADRSFLMHRCCARRRELQRISLSSQQLHALVHPKIQLLGPIFSKTHPPLTISTADFIQRLEASHSCNGEDHEGVVDLRYVDLAPDTSIGLYDLQPGEAPQCHGLPHNGEGCCNHCLQGSKHRVYHHRLKHTLTL